jgi:hypothetical protein
MFTYISCVSKCCISVLTYSAGVLLIARIKCAFAFTLLILGVIALAYISFFRYRVCGYQSFTKSVETIYIWMRHTLKCTTPYSKQCMRFMSIWICLSICVSPPLLGNGSVKSCRGYEDTHSKRRLVGGVVNYAPDVVSKESMRLVLPRISCFEIRKVS